ncbi:MULTISPECIES: YlqD family protein [Geomicrobium]|uniref:YlqD protein n=1 Tax=Geomicrobium sediminis TaxID=1347788 RepID=A0ABS2PAZ5_9BACL|nr:MULTISPECIES: YlqD family protein [Geomicrobium]MBM7632565.1 hypothetical protein [Geomicrobium sediminis]GAK00290.1 hypothetical protein JCM19055_3373 [Geomicrobium sp. JCM 19055]GAK07498.1 hypothetical protein JCM19038_1232 [Geomicrobium sp. JCM 19038]
MRIEKNVLVRHVLTEDYRKKLLTKMDQEKDRLTNEVEQLRFQAQKQAKEQTDAKNKALIKTRFNAEINKRTQRVESITFRENKIRTLPEGSLVTGDTVKRYTDIQVGDRWADHKLEDEIIVEDGVIKEIRTKGDHASHDVKH